MPRNLPKALQEARTALRKRELVYRGRVRARDVLRLLSTRPHRDSMASLLGTALIALGATIWVMSWFWPGGGADIVGPWFIAAGTVFMFIHGEIKRRR
jgi:hypothetical protein